ncbi:MAG: glycoside hydrolase family 2 protein [Phycisphaerae bacterium]|nr:glycoside hydrolase family 2 protein [Phycisphaerae bacterium]
MQFLILSLTFGIMAQAHEEHTARETHDLNTEWRFQKADPADAASPELDDSAWDSVTLPHTWNARDGQDGGNNYYRGPAWYRRAWEIPESLRSRRLFLRFGAANTVADVHFNGTHLGRHRGGFAAFAFEITPHIQFGKKNVLAVRVDNGHFEDVPPWSADFTFFGGLYRSVELLITGPTCISPLDHASPGVFITQTRVTDDRADLDVRTRLSHGANADCTARLIASVEDAEGKTVAEATQNVAFSRPGNLDVSQRLTIDKPHLWNGRKDPYLYAVRVRLETETQILDEVRQPLGLRYFRVDADKGFFLNGRPYALHGVNRHQDRLDKGWAIGKTEHDEDFALIRELGCTGVRLAHYQHDDYVYSLCDKAGLVVWAEIPLVNRIHDSQAFRDNARQQLVELIRQNYNHPSILFWGVHNEITAPWLKGSPDPTNLIRDLHNLAKTEDATRLTTCAGCDPIDHPANWQTDVVALNHYSGWYVGGPESFGPWIDGIRKAHPDKPIGISEYGAGASILHHEDPPAKPKHNGPWHPEEWQTLVHEQHWRAMQDRPYLWCTFIWNMFDFAVDGRNEGDTPGRNDKGLVTYDRRTRKDAFHAYKANWTDEPMVYIASRRFQERTTASANVRVYSNCEDVELFVNEKSLGPKRADHGAFVWPDVTLQSGRNAIRAVGRIKDAIVTDSCEWTLTSEN